MGRRRTAAPLDLSGPSLKINLVKDAAPAAALKLAAVLTVIFFLVEVAGGFISGSLSLLGDAWHMLRDIFALLISLSAIKVAERLPTKSRTFGFHRAEIMAAMLNGILLVGIGIVMIVEVRPAAPVSSAGGGCRDAGGRGRRSRLQYLCRLPAPWQP